MPVLRRQFLVSFATCSTVLIVACGPSHEPHVIQPRPRKVTVTVAVPDTTIVEKRQQLAALRWLATFVPVTAIPPTRVAVTGTQTFVHSSESPPTTPAVNGFDWSCVATAETGADFSAHGPSYSSAYGVMDEAVRENAPPDVAARIIDGTASAAEQLAMAESVEAKHGMRAWAPGTVARCAR